MTNHRDHDHPATAAARKACRQASSTTQPRFYIVDRAEGQSSTLTRWSSINKRYWIIDRTTGEVVDELMSRLAATGTVDLLTAQSLTTDADV